jgi:hypothetical protein
MVNLALINGLGYVCGLGIFAPQWKIQKDI